MKTGFSPVPFGASVPVPAALAGGNSPVRFGARAIALQTPVVDSVDLNSDKYRDAGILPPESPILLVPGLFAPTRSINGARVYFRDFGHPLVKSMKVPFIASGQDLEKAAWWLSDMVDDIRIRIARLKLAEFREAIAVEPSGENYRPEQMDLIRRYFRLEDSPAGWQLAGAMFDIAQDFEDRLPKLKTPYLVDGPKTLSEARDYVLKDGGSVLKLAKNTLKATKTLTMGFYSWIGGVEISDPLTFLQHLYKPKPPQIKLSNLMAGYRKQLMALPLEGYDNAAREKIVNRLLDGLAPRVILMGHSMGGMTATKTLQLPLDPDHADGQSAGGDVGMVVAMGSPLNGVEEPPKALGFLNRKVAGSPAVDWLKYLIGDYFPGLVQVLRGSGVVQKVQTLGIPDDTTVISISTPDDSLVSTEGTRLPEDRHNMHNLDVSTKSAGLGKALFPQGGGFWQPFDYLAELAGDVSEEWRGLLQHCLHIGHSEEHWSERGEVTLQILSELGRPDLLGNILHPANYERLREHTLDLLIRRTRDIPERRERYQPLIPMLEAMTKDALPFADSVDKKAGILLKILKAGE